MYHSQESSELIWDALPGAGYTDADIDLVPGIYRQSLAVAQQNWIAVPPSTPCPKCRPPEVPEVYTISTDWGELTVDVGAAWRCAQDGRPTATVSPLALLVRVSESEICRDHLAHLPPSVLTRPGVFAYMPAPDGTIRAQLIDGNHRAAQALLNRQWFRAYVLNPEETARYMHWRR